MHNFISLHTLASGVIQESMVSNHIIVVVLELGSQVIVRQLSSSCQAVVSQLSNTKYIDLSFIVQPF